MANQESILQETEGLLRRVAKVYNFENRIDAFLTPNRVVEVFLPLEINGKTRIFKGFRAQHNNTNGPYKGGIRFHEDVSREEVEALSLWMSLKTALVGVPFGGGKGGVVVNPKELSEKQLEDLSREFSRSLYEIIGPLIDIPAPDVNTNPKIIHWMVDEYAKIAKENNSQVKDSTIYASFTGKPLDTYGLAGRAEATGFGGATVLNELVKKLGKKNHDLTIAVQGFGNVGYYFSKFASDLGFKVVAVSDSKGGITDKDRTLKTPLDIEKVIDCKFEKGMVSGCYCVGGVCDLSEGRVISNSELLTLPVDILVPSALESVITKKNMKDIKAKIIIEMANGPVNPEAREYLTKKGVIIVPDILSNAGGVTASFIEWRQNMEDAAYKKDKVLFELEAIMKKAFNRVWKESKLKNIDIITASYGIALKKLIK